MFKTGRHISFLSLLLTVFLTGCLKNQFTVELSLGKNINLTYNTLHYASDSKKGWIVEGALQVVEGKATLPMPTRNPTIVYIFNGSKAPATFFYAERGDKITITGNSQNPLEWQISGNKINEQLTEWRKANASVLKRVQPGSGQDSSAINRVVEKYVNANSDSPAATLILLEYYDRRADEEGFRKCLAKLHGDAKEGKWMDVVSRSDMLDITDNNSIPPMLVLNTVATGCDTIKFGKVPVLLHFNRSSHPEYREYIRQLRQTVTESGDSSSRVIVNVSIEPDSMMRWQNARSDSLRNVVQGWTPMGISDSQLHTLGITRVPYLIVVDNNGKVVYRGDDMTRAAELFKQQLK